MQIIIEKANHKSKKNNQIAKGAMIYMQMPMFMERSRQIFQSDDNFDKRRHCVPSLDLHKVFMVIILILVLPFNSGE